MYKPAIYVTRRIKGVCSAETLRDIGRHRCADKSSKSVYDYFNHHNVRDITRKDT